jgi:hypothetical protein
MQGWQHIANDILNITGRSVLMFLLTLGAVRIMGKRSIAELAPFDLTVVIIMGSVAALPLEEEEIHILHGIVPIVVAGPRCRRSSASSPCIGGGSKGDPGRVPAYTCDGQVLRDNLHKEWRVRRLPPHYAEKPRGGAG